MSAARFSLSQEEVEKLKKELEQAKQENSQLKEKNSKQEEIISELKAEKKALATQNVLLKKQIDKFEEDEEKETNAHLKSLSFF